MHDCGKAQGHQGPVGTVNDEEVKTVKKWAVTAEFIRNAILAFVALSGMTYAWATLKLGQAQNDKDIEKCETAAKTLSGAQANLSSDLAVLKANDVKQDERLKEIGGDIKELLKRVR